MNELEDSQEVQIQAQVQTSVSQELVNPADKLLQLAISNDIEMDKLEKLMEMQRSWENRISEKKYNESMSLTQQEIQAVKAGQVNKQTNSKYADIVDIDRQIRPAYTKNGFAISFNTEKSDLEGHLRVVAYVTHKDGHKETRSIDVPADGKGAKGGDVMTKTHATMSAVTYGQRALVKMVFNVASGEFDDDGNAAGRKPESAPDGRKPLAESRLVSLLKNVKAGEIHLVNDAFRYFTLTEDQINKINAAAYPVAVEKFKAGELTIDEISSKINLSKAQLEELNKMSGE